jgi:hypothetical protein
MKHSYLSTTLKNRESEKSLKQTIYGNDQNVKKKNQKKTDRISKPVISFRYVRLL